MTPRLSKTLKVSAETHYHLKLFASYEGVSMAALLDGWVDEHKSFKSILTPEERQGISRIFSLGLDYRLNERHELRLPHGLIDDLHLAPGDQPFFVRNASGRWEVFTEAEGVTP